MSDAATDELHAAGRTLGANSAREHISSVARMDHTEEDEVAELPDGQNFAIKRCIPERMRSYRGAGCYS